MKTAENIFIYIAGIIFVNQSPYRLFLSADNWLLVSSCRFIGKSNKKTHFLLKFSQKNRKQIYKIVSLLHSVCSLGGDDISGGFFVHGKRVVGCGRAHSGTAACVF